MRAVRPEPVPSADADAWRRAAGVIALAALVGVALGFGWALGGDFLGDDFGYVGRFHDYPLARWPRLFVESWAGDMWGFPVRELRPVTALSFIADVRLWAGHALGFRLTNLALHLACATMVGLIAWRAAGRNRACGIAAAVLFALHPVHAEPVAWITGRVDVLATMFYLAGFLAFLRFRSRGGSGWLAALAFCFAGAAFAKEFGLTLPVMMLVADLAWLRRRSHWREARTWWPYLVCLGVAVGYFLCRRAAFGAGAGGNWPDLASVEFQRLFARRQLLYLGQLLPPLDRWWPDEGRVPLLHARRTLLVVTLIAAAGLVLWHRLTRERPTVERRATLFFALGWFLVATLPLVVTYISPRHLYLASAGLCVGLVLLLHAVVRARAGFLVAIVALSAFCGLRLIGAVKPWHRAAVISGEITRELRALEPAVRDGGALFLDVPELYGGVYVWTWAVPAALRPPFTRTALDRRLVVLESRGLYIDWERWHQQPAIAALRGVEKDGVIVQRLNGQPLRRFVVPAARVRAAAERFAALPLQQQPHESWRTLINELSAP